MSTEEKEQIRLSDCNCINPDDQLETCQTQCFGGIDLMQIYEMTLRAILDAQEQVLRLRTPKTGSTPTITCRIPSTCPVGFQGRYTVVSGDSMFSIAQRCGVTLQALISANPHISNPDQIFPCDVLCVPPRCATVGVTCRVPASCPPGFLGRYTVRSGDSMFSIAQRCGVTLQALISANPHISNPNQIFPCDVLCVPLQCASRLESEEVKLDTEN